MGIVDIFSKRQRRMRGEFPDVYQYDDLPTTFRTQVVFILTDLFSYEEDPWRNRCFKSIHNILAREFGVFRLYDRANNPWDEVIQFFGSSQRSVQFWSVSMANKSSIVSDLHGWRTPSVSGEELQAPGKSGPQ